MPAIPLFLATDRLLRLRPSDIYNIKENISDNQFLISLLKETIDCLIEFKEPNEADLDEVYNILIKFNSAGLWKKIDSRFLISILPDAVDPRVLNELCRFFSLTPDVFNSHELSTNLDNGDLIVFAAVCHYLGEYFEKLEKFDASLEEFSLSAEFYKRLKITEPTNTGWGRAQARALLKVGDVLESSRKLPEAFSAFEESTTIIKELLKIRTNDPGLEYDLSVSLHKAGDILLSSGRIEDAIKLFNSDLKISKKLSKNAPDDFHNLRDHAVVLEKIGIALSRLGKSQDGLRNLEKSRKIYETIKKRNPNDSRWSLYLQDNSRFVHRLDS